MMKVYITFILCLLPLAATQSLSPPPEPKGCDVIACLNPLNCGPFEQCLLLAQKNGCHPSLIAYSAYEAYRQCLFGEQGFCSLSPLVDCYRKHMEDHTKTRLPPSTSHDPTSLEVFIRVLLEDATDFTKPSQFCSIPVSAAQQMTRCVLASSGNIVENCAAAMPIATNRYFSVRGNLKQSLNIGINGWLTALANYSMTCSQYGEWTRWFNDFTPSSNNASDIEITADPCGGGNLPLDIDCDLDDTRRQMCGAGSCLGQQSYTCSVSPRYPGPGLICYTFNQGSPEGSCPCCDYKVRYLCPVIDSIIVSPTYGPESGNTSLTIIGGRLRFTSFQVRIGNSSCAIQEREIFRVVCTVPPWSKYSNPDRIAPVILSDGRTDIVTNTSYTYKNNVQVKRILNLDTPVSGGTNVTVMGENLKSLTQPLMVITVYYTQNSVLQTWVFQSTCWIKSNTRLDCPVPALVNPFEFTKNETKPTPQAPYSLTSNMEERDEVKTGWQHPLRLTGRYPARQRRKRATCGAAKDVEPVNDNDQLRYEVDLILDGNRYPGVAMMNVYEDPIINRFRENPECRILRRWMINSDTQMEIQGSRLGGIKCQDYNIRVGNGVCVIKDLFSNQIICNPPENKPNAAITDPDGKLMVEVKIGNGNLRYSVGCLDYEEGLLDNTYGQIGLIAGLSLLVLIFLGVAICCCYHYRKKLASK